MNFKSFLQKTGLILVSVLFTLFLAEITLRVLYPSETRYYVWQPNLKHIFTPDPTILPGVHGPGHFTINSYGIRTNEDDLKNGPNLFYEPDKNELNRAEKYYLCIGGSTTECLYLDDNATWCRRLAEIAHNEQDTSFRFIGSIGKSGCLSRENYIQIKYCLPQYKKITTVIVMTGINDFLHSLSDSGFRKGDFRFTPQSEDSMVNTILLKQGRNYGETWWRRTALFHLFQGSYQRNKLKNVEWVIQDDNGKIYKTWRSYRQKATVVIDTLPDLTAALKEYEINLNLMIDEAKQQHKEIIFAGNSAMWKDSMTNSESALLWMGGVGKFQAGESKVYYSPRALRKGLSMYNQSLEKVCRERKVRFIDIDSELPHTINSFYDDCHFNEGGAKAVAQIIYRELQTPL